MKIAIHNTFLGGKLAETELSRRLILAAENLGWDAIEVGSSTAINQYSPDLVLTLHFKTPKLTQFPTYGCLWHPVIWVETDAQFIRNTLSYDAYLSSSPITDRWLRDRLYNTPKNYFIAPFFTSCNSTLYRQPQLRSPRLAYVGSNWDGERYKDLFLELEKLGCIDIYGSKDGWSYLRSSYRGSLPFDGTSVLERLNQAGVGLCLHREEHTQEGVPSMRIFEIVASGAIAICGDHPFIKTHFADTVLYLDLNLSAVEQAAQIKSHLAWIQQNQETALAMTKAAHQIFVEQFSLEKLLANLENYHQNLIRSKGFASPIATALKSSHSSLVDLILTTRDRDLSSLKKTLESIQKQTYSNISVILVKDPSRDDLDGLLNIYQDRLRLQMIDRQDTTNSSYLWSGITRLSGQYFGVLTDDVVLHPNHVATLVSLLDRFPQWGIAYSEVIQSELQNALSDDRLNSPATLEQSVLATLQPDLDDLMPFAHLAHGNSFLARSSLMDEWLRQDPQLEILEDWFLLINLGARGSGIFSYEVTCEIKVGSIEPSTLDGAQAQQVQAAIRRIRSMMSDREFPMGRRGNDSKLRLRLQQAEAQLQQAQQRVVAMETSKFWQLRTHWFQLKRKLGLKTDKE